MRLTHVCHTFAKIARPPNSSKQSQQNTEEHSAHNRARAQTTEQHYKYKYSYYK